MSTKPQIVKKYTPEEVRQILRADFIAHLSDAVLFSINSVKYIHVMFDSDQDGVLEEVTIAVDL